MATTDLLGAHEAAQLFGLTRAGLRKRRAAADFPAPAAELACGPVWTRAQLVEYARRRSARYYERPAVEALAGRGEDVLSLEEAARILAVPVGRLRALLEGWAWGPGRFDLKTNTLVGVRRADLGLVARALGVQVREVAAA
ncbi:MAG TPA: hypothetical protein VNK94_11340 [Gaiellaceae bacterium]|nr:hypothetical protein [Gaiellaceae bacterium]